MPVSWLQWRTPERLSGVLLLSFCIWFVCCAAANPIVNSNISENISPSPEISTIGYNVIQKFPKNKLPNSTTVNFRPNNENYSMENKSWAIFSPTVANVGDSMTKFKNWTRITASDVTKLNRQKNQSMAKHFKEYFSYDKIPKVKSMLNQVESGKYKNKINSDRKESERLIQVDFPAPNRSNLSRNRFPEITLTNALYLSRTDRSSPNTKENQSKESNLNFQSLPRKRYITSVRRNERDHNLERNERSANLSHISGTARKVQLYIKNRFIQLLPDGIVNGTTDELSDYSK